MAKRGYVPLIRDSWFRPGDRRELHKVTLHPSVDRFGTGGQACGVTLSGGDPHVPSKRESSRAHERFRSPVPFVGVSSAERQTHAIVRIPASAGWLRRPGPRHRRRPLRLLHVRARRPPVTRLARRSAYRSEAPRHTHEQGEARAPGPPRRSHERASARDPCAYRRRSPHAGLTPATPGPCLLSPGRCRRRERRRRAPSLRARARRWRPRDRPRGRVDTR